MNVPYLQPETRLQVSSTGASKVRNALVGTLSAVFAMETALRAAGVAFFVFLSIFPVIASSVLILGLIADASALVPLLEWLRPFAPESAMDILERQLLAILSQPRGGLGIGLLVSVVIALWSGTRGINALVYAICHTQNLPVERSVPAAIGLSIVLTFGGLLVVGIALAAIAAIPAIVGFFPVPKSWAQTIMLARWPFLFLVIVLSLITVYHLAPGQGMRRRYVVWPGALLASVLWIAVSLAFSFYVENVGSFEATFGSLAATVILLLWLYNSVLIVMAGAALNAQYERRHPLPPAVGGEELDRALNEVTASRR